MIGANLKKKDAGRYINDNYHFPYVEIVPENWDPNSSKDKERLLAISEKSQILLHSLSLNIFGSGPQDWVIERVNFWAEFLGINEVSDHFSWTGYSTNQFGIFIPPITTDQEILNRQYHSTQNKIVAKIHLENITSYYTNDKDLMGYHEALSILAKQNNIGIVLDIENICLECNQDHVKVCTLINNYQTNNQLYYLHVAGSEENLDTHSADLKMETLNYLNMIKNLEKLPIVYELDYHVSLEKIQEQLSIIKDGAWKL